jgi:outer membrane immunogenic protein
MRIGVLLVATGMALASAPAVAADFGDLEPLPTPEVSVAEPANDWSGFYLGALLGYSWGDADTDPYGDTEAEGVDGGGYAGATWQFGNFVLGAEADVMASDVSSDNGAVTLDQGVHGSLRARAGIALDQFLLYGTAGGAATEAELSGFGDSDDEVLFGWTAGAGAEAMLTDNITARVEYRYTDYEDQTFTLGGAAADADLSTHSVRAGIGVQF